MATVEELRQYCESLNSKRKEELKSVLNEFFYYTFIVCHRPFRAIIGNRKCKPVPMDRGCLIFSGDTVKSYQIKWPNIPEELLRRELENLGFVVDKDRISISVPPYVKGAKLSFAQEWVKKINASYSKYCANEKKAAKEMYPEFISALYSLPVERIKTYEGFTLFCDFKFNRIMSPICAKYIKKFMKRDGIKDYYEDGEYRGIIVYNNPN